MQIKNSLKAFFASSIGTILEWYDFTLFAYLTPLLAKLFFPQKEALTGLLLTYSIFAIGFFVRPLGAILFGHIGDRFGRKLALTFTILLMSIPTFLMGLLPTYESVGILAPTLLIFLRICQGLSAGGESTGASLFVLEGITHKHRGFIGGLLWAVVGMGMLLGSFAATLVNHSALLWAWRIPFLIGILTGLIGYFVRTRTLEPEQFLRLKEQNEIAKRPLVEALMSHKKSLSIIIGLYCLSAMITYLVFVFMPNYAATTLAMPVDKTSLIATCALLASTILVPFGGFLSDQFGRRKCLVWGALGFAIFSYPLFLLILKGSLSNLILAEAIFVILAACYQGTLTAASFELAPTRLRYSMVAFGYNFSYSIFGGTAPLIATYLVTLTGNPAFPGLYLAFGAIVALLSISFRTTKIPF